ncbi:MAG: class I SAM-dependent methyltransferase [Cyanobacteria bacterium P01_H01_bin.35]
MNDLYQKLADYYDDFVQKNRNYEKIADQLSKLIGNGRELLDIGIGTGLLVKYLLQIEPNYNVVGIDTSEALLEKANKRLGNKVSLYCQSVSEINIDKIFDVSYSRGGAWTIFKDETGIMLGSHILDLDEIQKSFQCVSDRLKTGGLLIISTSNVNSNKLMELENGIIHKRTAEIQQVKNESYARFEYSFHKDEKLLTQQTLMLRLLSPQEFVPMLNEAGFMATNIDDSEYYIYRRTEV